MQLLTNTHSDNEAGGVWHVQLNKWLVCECAGHKYRNSQWMEVLHVQGHLYLVCLSETPQLTEQVSSITPFLFSTGLQKAPLLLEEMQRCTSLWSLFGASPHFQMWFIISECHFWCHFCLWFSLAAGGFFPTSYSAHYILASGLYLSINII